MYNIFSNQETAEFWNYLLSDKMEDYFKEELSDCRSWVELHPNNQDRAFEMILDDVRWIIKTADLPFSRSFLDEIDPREIAEPLHQHAAYGVKLEKVFVPREEKKRMFFLRSRINGKTKIAHEDLGGNQLLDVSNEPGMKENKREMDDLTKTVCGILEKAAIAYEVFEPSK